MTDRIEREIRVDAPPSGCSRWSASRAGGSRTATGPVTGARAGREVRYAARPGPLDAARPLPGRPARRLAAPPALAATGDRRLVAVTRAA